MTGGAALPRPAPPHHLFPAAPRRNSPNRPRIGRHLFPRKQHPMSNDKPAATGYGPYSPVPASNVYGSNEPPTRPRPKFNRKLIWPAVATIALLLGIGIGTGNKPEPETTVETKTVQGPERVVTKNVEVPVTPQSCLDALTITETAFTYLSESMQHILDADYAAAEKSTARVKALVPKSNAAKAECRAAAK